MNDTDHEKSVIAHLKKPLRARHMALAAADKAESGHMVTDPLRVSIREVHISLDVVEGRT